MIDPKCGNPELINIPHENRKLLDQSIFDSVLSKYRDHDREAEIRESQQRSQRYTPVNSIEPVTFSQRYTRSTTSTRPYQAADHFAYAGSQDQRLRGSVQNLQRSIENVRNPSICPCVLM